MGQPFKAARQPSQLGRKEPAADHPGALPADRLGGNKPGGLSTLPDPRRDWLAVGPTAPPGIVAADAAEVAAVGSPLC
jgi:hypothetical protein